MKRKLLFITICCLMIFASCSTEDVNNFTANSTSEDTNEVFYVPQVLNDFISTDNVVVAHRGAWAKKKLPQNSIASLQEAIQLKCKGSEFDIMLTADDSLVVCHGPQYNGLDVQKAKYADLITLKLTNGEKLPTLREYISVAKENNATTKLFCELKNYSLTPERRKVFILNTLLMVEKLKAHQFMVYISFDYEIIKQIRAVDSYANIQYLAGDKNPDQLKVDNISGADFALSIYKNNIDWISNAKKNNITLNVWTLNQSLEMNWALDYKFDYITTDEPELLLYKK